MEIVQGVLIRAKVEGQQAVEKMTTSLDGVTVAADKAGAAASAAATKTRDAAKGMTDWKQSAEQLASQGLGPVTSQLATLSRFIIPVGIAVGIASIAKTAIDAADALAQMEARTGVAARDLSIIGHAAKMADTDIQSVGVGFKSMARVVDDAVQGNAELQKSFASVGLSVADLKAKNPRDVFLAIATGVAAIEDPSIRAARAQELMGKAGTDLLPLMKNLAGDGFAKASAEAERLGVIIDTKTARAAADFNDNVNRLKIGLGGIGVAIATAALPGLIALTTHLEGTGTATEKSTEEFEDWIDVATSVKGALAAMGAGFRTLLVVMEASMRATGAYWDNALALKSPLAKAQDFLKELDKINKDADLKIKQLNDTVADAMLGGSAAERGSGHEAGPGSAHALARDWGTQFGPTSFGAEQLAHLARIDDVNKRITKDTEKQAREAERVAKAAEREMEARAKSVEYLNAQMKAVTYIGLAAVDPSINADTLARMRLKNSAGFEDEARAFKELELSKLEQGFAKLNYDENIRLEKEKKLLEDWTRAHNQFTTRLSDVFTSLALSGGESFGQIAGHRFSELVTSGFDVIMADIFGKAGEDGQLRDSAGNVLSGGRKAFAQAASGVFDYASVGVSAYGGAKEGEGSRTGSVVSGAAAGFQIAGGWGAVVGAIVGAVGGYFGEQARQDEYKYGVPQFTDGRANLVRPEELTAADRLTKISQLQATFDTTWNAFTAAMLKLPGATMPSKGAFTGGAFQPEASANWEKHFGEYLKDTLPRELADLFKTGMEEGFVHSGMTKDAFAKFWTEADKLDPARRAQFWTDMAEGVGAWGRAVENMGAVQRTIHYDPMERGGLPGFYDGRAGFASSGREQLMGESEFKMASRTAAEGLFSIAREMVNLSGPDRVNAFRRLAEGAEQLTLSLQDFIAGAAQSLKNVAASFGDARLEKEIERAADPKAKGDILYREYRKIEQQVQMAEQLGLSPQEIEALTNRGIGLLNQIYEQDPSDKMYEWWLGQMSTLEGMATESIKAITLAAEQQVTDILMTLEPFREWFLGLPVDLQDAWDHLDGSIEGAATALEELARVINATTGGGEPGGGPGKGDPGDGPGNPPQPDPSNVTINIDVHGDWIDEARLRFDILNALRAAIQRAPDTFEGPF